MVFFHRISIENFLVLFEGNSRGALLAANRTRCSSAPDWSDRPFSPPAKGHACTWAGGQWSAGLKLESAQISLAAAVLCSASKTKKFHQSGANSIGAIWPQPSRVAKAEAAAGGGTSQPDQWPNSPSNGASRVICFCIRPVHPEHFSQFCGAVAIFGCCFPICFESRHPLNQILLREKHSHLTFKTSSFLQQRTSQMQMFAIYSLCFS